MAVIIAIKTKIILVPTNPIHNLHLTIEEAKENNISKIISVLVDQTIINNSEMTITAKIKVMTGIIEAVSNMITEAANTTTEEVAGNMTTVVQANNNMTLGTLTTQVMTIEARTIVVASMTIEVNHIRATKRVHLTTETSHHLKIVVRMIDENRTMLETLIKMKMIGEVQ